MENTVTLQMYSIKLNRRLVVTINDSDLKDIMAQKELIKSKDGFIYKNDDIMIWLSGAHKFEWDSEEEKLEYIDSYNKLRMPNGDIVDRNDDTLSAKI